MYELLVEAGGELLAVLAYSFATSILTLLGVLAERTSLQQYAAGQDASAVWLAFMGAVALYAGLYMLGYRGLLTNLLARRA